MRATAAVLVVVAAARVAAAPPPCGPCRLAVEITKPRTRGGRHCIHGGRKECPDVGFQKRGSGKEACALLAKLVT